MYPFTLTQKHSDSNKLHINFLLIISSAFVLVASLFLYLIDVQIFNYMAAQPRDCVNSSPWSQNRYVSQEPDKEGFLTRQMKCKYSVKYYNKIKKTKDGYFLAKSMLFYSENDEGLTFFAVVHWVDTRWSHAPLWLPSAWSISSSWQNFMTFPFVHNSQRLQKCSCFYDRLLLIFWWEFDSELYIKLCYLFFLSFSVNSWLLWYFFCANVKPNNVLTWHQIRLTRREIMKWKQHLQSFLSVCNKRLLNCKAGMTCWKTSIRAICS